MYHCVFYVLNKFTSRGENNERAVK